MMAESKYFRKVLSCFVDSTSFTKYNTLYAYIYIFDF